MESRNTSHAPWLRRGLLLGAVVAALGLAACGSSSATGSGSSGSAQDLVKQTFSTGHPVKSGVLGMNLTINPAGSSTVTTPVSFSIVGPFQGRGTGKLPASNFTIAVSALGHRGQLGIISTGTAGYVTLQGTAYRLPTADFQRLRSGFSSVGGSSAGSGGLAGLGINPLHWLTNPTIVGTDTVGGAECTHIRAGVNATALLADLNTFLAKAASSSQTKIPSSIPPATQQKIAAAIKNATVDLWTGKSDKTLRKLSLNLTVPVTGRVSTLGGGVSSAGIRFTIQYSDVNQTQSIPAPATAQPYGQFTTKLRALLGGLTGAVGAGATGSTASGTSSAGASASVEKYSQCIESAGQDVLKMQKCASLLKSK